MLDRSAHKARLHETRFDLLIIGGGATGTGIALDAATRGLRVALVERGDFGSGTSSRSTKLIHGGVRYLEKAFLEFDRSQFNLVRDALKERSVLARMAPHLVRALPIFTPIYRRFEIPYYLTGLKLYDRLAGRANLHSSHFVGANKALQRFPMLRTGGLKGGVVYYDGQFDDARMNVSLALTAAENGATLLNYAAVTEFELSSGGHLIGATVQDRIAGDTFPVRADVVVNAAGPFVDQVRRMEDPHCDPMLSVSSGAHIVLPPEFTPPEIGFLVPKTDDGRVLFVLPWRGYALAGTTDNPAKLEENPEATEQDIEYILGQMNRYYASPPSRDQVLSAWSGLRPLVSNPRSMDTAGLVRDHVIFESPGGLVTIAGGKWTTYRKMAEDVVDYLVKQERLKARPCRTESLPLVGGENYTKAFPSRLEKEHAIDGVTARHLSQSYGDRAEKVLAHGTKRLVAEAPFLEGEVVYGTEVEGAQKVADLVCRRTRMAFLDEALTRQALPRITEIMGDVLGWDGPRRKQELAEAQSSLV